MPAPTDDSLMWTASMSLKNFYQESMHQFCNEALRYNIKNSKTPEDNEKFLIRLAEEMAQERFFYKNYVQYLPKENQQPFKSVYAEAYAIYNTGNNAHAE
jgi:hypothetical protein